MRFLAIAVAVAALACGPTYKLQAIAGPYSTGSGLTGLAVFGSVEEYGGPSTSGWRGSILDASGQVVAADVRLFSNAPCFWTARPEVVVSPGDRLTLQMSGAGGDLSVELQVPDYEPLPAPVMLNATSGLGQLSLTWSAVSDAQHYKCDVEKEQKPWGDPPGSTAPVCDLTMVPTAGQSLVVTQRAFSTDRVALCTGFAPQAKVGVPPWFAAAEGRMGIQQDTFGGPAATVRAAGGRVAADASSSGLAFLVAIDDPSAREWDVSVQGPGLAGQAWGVTYPAGAAQLVAYKHDVPAVVGRYTLTAHAAAGGALSVPFFVGAPALLSVPADVSVQPLPGGAATVTWSAVPSARSYRVSTWDTGMGTLAKEAWLKGTSASFVTDTFTAGHRYDVFVAAADVDVTSATASSPGQVSVAEDRRAPVSFTAQ